MHVASIWSVISLLHYYFVTMPYLNFIKKSDQNELCQPLPLLYQGLKNGNLTTLKEYHVEWTHISMKDLAPTLLLDKHLLERMLHASAGGVKMQCG